MENRIRISLLNGMEVQQNEFKDWLTSNIKELRDDADEQEIIIVRLYTADDLYKSHPDSLDAIIKELLNESDNVYMIDNVRVAPENLNWEAEIAKTPDFANRYLTILLRDAIDEIGEGEEMDSPIDIAFGLADAALVKAPEILKPVKEDMLKCKGKLSQDELHDVMNIAKNLSKDGSCEDRVKMNLQILVSSYTTLYRGQQANVKEEIEFELALFIAYYLNHIPKVIITAGMLAALYESNKQKVSVSQFLTHYSGFLDDDVCERLWDKQVRLVSEFQILANAQPVSKTLH